MNYWLIKSEADCYSIDDLKKDTKTAWGGVRNYQARNFMKSMKVGDKIIFYHSGANPPAAVGIAKVSKEAYPEKEDPTWYQPEIVFVEKFHASVTLAAIKFDPKLKGIVVAQQGSRLSVQPMSEKHFERIVEMGMRREE